MYNRPLTTDPNTRQVRKGEKGRKQEQRFGRFEDYKRRFEEAGKLGREMIKAVMGTEVIREEEERRGLEH